MRIPEKRHAKSNDEYYYEFSIDHLKEGGAEIWRSHKQVYRTSDNKLLGESASYTRRGGDLPGPWSESSFSCPDGASAVDLKKQIFIPEN
jgi:hypothetical protein